MAWTEVERSRRAPSGDPVSALARGVSDARRSLDAEPNRGARSFARRQCDRGNGAPRRGQARGAERQCRRVVRIDRRGRAVGVAYRRQRRQRVAFARVAGRTRQDLFRRLEQRRLRERARAAVVAERSHRCARGPSARPHREANAREEDSSESTTERHGAAVWIALGPSGKRGHADRRRHTVVRTLSSQVLRHAIRQRRRDRPTRAARTQRSRAVFSDLSGRPPALRPHRRRAGANDPARIQRPRWSTSGLVR